MMMIIIIVTTKVLLRWIEMLLLFTVYAETSHSEDLSLDCSDVLSKYSQDIGPTFSEQMLNVSSSCHSSLSGVFYHEWRHKYWDGCSQKNRQ